MKKVLLLTSLLLLTISCERQRNSDKEQSNLLTKSDLEGRVFLGPSNAVFYFKGGKVETYRPPYYKEYWVDSWVKEFDGGWWKGITDTLVLFNSHVRYTFDKNYTAHIPNFVDGRYGYAYHKIDPIFEINEKAVIDSNNLFTTLTGQPWMVFSGKDGYYSNFEDLPEGYMGYTTDSVCKIFEADETNFVKFKLIDGNNSFQLVDDNKSLNIQIVQITNSYLIVRYEQDGPYALFKPLVLDAVLPVITGEKLYH